MVFNIEDLVIKMQILSFSESMMIIVVADEDNICSTADSVDVEALLIVVTELLNGASLSCTSRRSVGRVNVSGVAEVRTGGVYRCSGVVFNLLSNEVVSLFANAGIESLDIIRELWAG